MERNGTFGTVQTQLTTNTLVSAVSITIAHILMLNVIATQCNRIR
jgi:hypothetical protein